MTPYSFRSLTEADLPLLFRWASEPHVKKWWNTESDWESFHQRYARNIHGKESFPHLALYENTPFAYINYWPVENNPDFANLFPQDSLGMDQFIGEPSLTGKGHGTNIVKIFSDQLLQTAPKVMVDPNSANAVAIACYKKAGFHPVKEMQSREGRILLLEKPTARPIP